MEKAMRDFCLNKDNYGYTALNQAYYFWLIIDDIYTSNKADIYKHLYLTPSCFNDTYVKISLEFGVSLRTLERYRKDFVSSFEIISKFIVSTNILSKAG